MKTKPFLLVFFGVAFAGWILLLAAFGPTGYSRAFQETPFAFNGQELPRKVAHDRYLAIIKSDAYKRFAERPALHPPVPDAFAGPGMAVLSEGNLAFAHAYAGDPLLRAERSRQFWFNWLFNVFSCTLLIVLVVKFTRQPIAKMLEKQAEAVRATLDQAAQVRAEAEERFERIHTSVDNLPEERKRLDAETDDRIARELAEAEAANASSVALFERHAQDRKHKEALQAAMTVKRELVNESIARVVEKLRSDASPEDHAGWLHEFSQDLERRAT